MWKGENWSGPVLALNIGEFQFLGLLLIPIKDLEGKVKILKA